MSEIIPLDEIKTFYPRIGKISAGYKSAKTTNGRTVTFPVRSDTLVFRSDDRSRLEAIAAKLGGAVTSSPDPATEGTWRLISKAASVDVVVPANDRRGWAAVYEFWGAGGKLRECDGRTCRFAVDPQTGERREDIPCVCRELELEGDQACKLTSRLNVILPDLLDVPGLGVWQVESRGTSTYMALQGTVNFLEHAGGIMGVPLVLRVEIRQSRDPNGQIRKWPVLTLVAKESLARAAVRARKMRRLIDPANVPAPEDSTPPLGAVMTPEEMHAADEAETGTPIAVLAAPASQTAHVPAPPVNTPPQTAPESTKTRSGRPTTTDFWKVVRRAAALQSMDPVAWLTDRTGGVPDIRQLTDDQIRAVYGEAQRLVTDPQGDLPPAAPAPESNNGQPSYPQMASLQTLFREKRISAKAQAALIQTASQKRTAIVNELTAAETDTLIAMLTTGATA